MHIRKLGVNWVSLTPTHAMTRTAELSLYHVFCNPIIRIGLSMVSKNNGNFGSMTNLPYNPYKDSEGKEHMPFFPIYQVKTAEFL